MKKASFLISISYLCRHNILILLTYDQETTSPPVGELRWKRPQPVVKWDGVKVADTFSNICWQPGNAVGTFYGNELYWKEQTVQSEDSLYLNIWTPTNAVGQLCSYLMKLVQTDCSF